MGDGNKMIIELVKGNYDEILGTHEKIVLDFNAKWCGQCKMVAPKVSEISEKKGDWLFYSVDADLHQELAEKYSITALPTFVVLEKGKEIARGGINFFLEWADKQ